MPSLSSWHAQLTRYFLPVTTHSATLSRRSPKMNSPKATSSPSAHGECGSAAAPSPWFFAFPALPGVILIVGHGSSLASLTRALTGLRSRDSRDFAQMVQKVRGFYSIRKPLGCFVVFLIRRLLMQLDVCNSMPAPVISSLVPKGLSHRFSKALEVKGRILFWGLCMWLAAKSLEKIFIWKINAM